MKHSWKQLPDRPRRILTFIAGALLIATSALIGWIPGPGGMIPFLLGIAVLASEFTWAERFRDYVLSLLKQGGQYVRRHPLLGTVFTVLTVTAVGIFAYVLYTKIL